METNEMITALEELATLYMKNKEFEKAKLINSFINAIHQVEDLERKIDNLIFALGVEQDKWNLSMRKLEEAIAMDSLMDEIPLHYLVMEENRKFVDNLIKEI